MATPDRRTNSRRRSWGQRLLLALNCVVIVACFGVAGGVVIGHHYGRGIVRVELPSADQQADAAGRGDGETTGTAADGGTGSAPLTTDGNGPTETFPDVDPEALNFLITGADNHACIDPSSPFAGAFGDRESSGERSDTIMLLRLDPASKKAAVLSFPRDLWVDIAGRSNPNRINTAYERDHPARLVETINQNFGLTVDHFVQVDFCAFKNLVDAVGGVTVPFEYAANDDTTGLNVPEAGCFTFNGDHALAYVRSRHYHYLDNGVWKLDGASDLGRISRQQDFLRRVLASALAKGLNPGVARGIIKAVQDNVVVDTTLTAGRMLAIAGIMADFEPGAIATYQVPGEDTFVGENRVLIPRIKGENMQAILAIFRGDAPLAGAPVQVLDTAPASASGTTAPAGAPATTAAPTATTTATTVDAGVPSNTEAGPEQQVPGIVPPAEMEC